MRIGAIPALITGLLLATTAVGKPKEILEVENRFVAYLGAMEEMQRDCLSKKGSPTQGQGMVCLCKYLGNLLTFKDLVVTAAKKYPDDMVTFRAKGQSKSVKLADIAAKLEETNKLVELCKNPEKTAKDLLALKVKSKRIVAKSRLKQIYDAQRKAFATKKKYESFAALGAGEKSCRAKQAGINLGDCQSDPYRYSIVVSEDGKRFRIQARTLTGTENGLYPGCQTADVWTMDEREQVAHVVNATSSCQ